MVGFSTAPPGGRGGEGRGGGMLMLHATGALFSDSALSVKLSSSGQHKSKNKNQTNKQNRRIVKFVPKTPGYVRLRPSRFVPLTENRKCVFKIGILLTLVPPWLSTGIQLPADQTSFCFLKPLSNLAEEDRHYPRNTVFTQKKKSKNTVKSIPQSWTICSYMNSSLFNEDV